LHTNTNRDAQILIDEARQSVRIDSLSKRAYDAGRSRPAGSNLRETLRRPYCSG
jgi:hypothetical protein